MSLIPYMVSFIAGTIGWSAGKSIGGMFGAILVSLIASALGFYYARKYVQGLRDSMGL